MQNDDPLDRRLVKQMEELDETLEATTKVFDEVTVYGFERKSGVPLEKMGLEFFTPEEVQKHVDFALRFAGKRGCLVTRGGKVPVKEMRKADKRKHKLYDIRSRSVSCERQ